MQNPKNVIQLKRQKKKLNKQKKKTKPKPKPRQKTRIKLKTMFLKELQKTENAILDQTILASFTIIMNTKIMIKK